MSRVAHRLCGDPDVHPLSLRRDFERHSQGLGLSEALSFRLQGYEEICHDEIAAEGEHRSYKVCAVRSRVSRLAWRASKRREQQNLKEHAALEAALKGESFVTYFTYHKCIMQTNSFICRPR